MRCDGSCRSQRLFELTFADVFVGLVPFDAAPGDRRHVVADELERQAVDELRLGRTRTKELFIRRLGPGVGKPEPVDLAIEKLGEEERAAVKEIFDQF